MRRRQRWWWWWWWTGGGDLLKTLTITTFVSAPLEYEQRFLFFVQIIIKQTPFTKIIYYKSWFISNDINTMGHRLFHFNIHRHFQESRKKWGYKLAISVSFGFQLKIRSPPLVDAMSFFEVSSRRAVHRYVC